MPFSTAPQRFKRFRQHFGLGAPRVAIRTHIGWQWYAAGASVLVLLGVLLTLAVERFGATAPEIEAARLRGQVESLRQALDRAGTEQSALQVAQGANAKLEVQLKVLEKENAALREDLAFFDHIVDQQTQAGVRIEKFTLTPEVEPGHFHYRLLVGFQPDRGNREFRGEYRFILTLDQGGKEVQMPLPSSGDGKAAVGGVVVRVLQRQEGSFEVPAGTLLKGIEVQIVQGGKILAHARTAW
jgi:hypothetical protein